jgi:hypothetical protein
MSGRMLGFGGTFTTGGQQMSTPEFALGLAS